ncbi:hypothetical protein LU666_30460, partial [Pseudomonas putida]|nr:hypothetical protein [Pseudomonas putida]
AENRSFRRPQAAHFRLMGNLFGVSLDLDQQQRISLVLNIHASLRAVFANQENVQGFPLLENANDFFEGRSPLEVMAQGDMISLYETYRRIEHLHQSS